MPPLPSVWEAKLTPALAEDMRRRRFGKAGRNWYVDETDIEVEDRWCDLYRAIDCSGALVDVIFSKRRDMAAAKAFFRSARTVTGITPDRVTTDSHDSDPRAIRTELLDIVPTGNPTHPGGFAPTKEPHMTVPKMQSGDAPARVASLGHNLDGTMWPGIPDGMENQNSTATPTSDCDRTETAPTRIQKG